MSIKIFFVLLNEWGKEMLVNIDGLNVNYECSGEGETVFLLHGWGGQIASFKPVFDFLSQKFKVYAIDFPGFGQSVQPKEVWGVRDYAEMINKLFEALGVQKATLIGHSFGGRVAIVFSAEYPEKVNKVVLIDSSGLVKKKTMKYYYKVYSFKLLKKIYLMFIPKNVQEQALEKFYTKYGSADYKSAGTLRNIFVKVVNEDLRAYMPKIKASTLLVWGENDQDTPVSFGEYMKKAIPDAGLVVLKDAGHFSYLDKLNDFCIIVMNFLSQK